MIALACRKCGSPILLAVDGQRYCDRCEAYELPTVEAAGGHVLIECGWQLRRAQRENAALSLTVGARGLVGGGRAPEPLRAAA